MRQARFNAGSLQGAEEVGLRFKFGFCAVHFDIAVFEGDGIGPEITAPTVEILRKLAAASGDYTLAFRDAPAGAAHYAKTGESLPKASMDLARASDAILASILPAEPGISRAPIASQRAVSIAW